MILEMFSLPNGPECGDGGNAVPSSELSDGVNAVVPLEFSPSAGQSILAT
jgi:hypothetical protein